MNQQDYLDATYDMFVGSIDGEEAESTRFDQWLSEVEKDDLFAFEARRLSSQGTEVEMRRTTGTSLRVINMSSYNYLGLSYHPEVIEAAKAALDRYGLGAASSPVHSGMFDLHVELEQALTEFLGLPGRAVSLFSSGYAVNTGTISALMKKGHRLVMDRAVHMSILEGAQLGRARPSYFEHNDPEDLEAVLEELDARSTRTLVCTEGVFSADGDYGRLPEIVGVAKRHGAMVLVDEAHSFLACGEHGRGCAERAGVLDQVDLFVTTFSKALGGVGGALIAPRAIARYVNWYARCRMFSCALDPAITGGVLQALKIAASGEGQLRRARLEENAERLRARLSGRVDLGRSESWIVTVVYGEEERTLPLIDYLQRNGLDASVMQFPAVPIGESRLRLFVTSEHTTEQIDRAADILLAAADEFGFAALQRRGPRSVPTGLAPESASVCGPAVDS